jgi:hypothetical protein
MADKHELLHVARDLLLGGLPYEQIRDSDGSVVTEWRRQARTAKGVFSLSLHGDSRFGLPFGKDRVVLAWLQREAKRQGSRAIQWKYAAEFFKAMGLPDDGFQYRQFWCGLIELSWPPPQVAVAKRIRREKKKFLRMLKVSVRNTFCVVKRQNNNEAYFQMARGKSQKQF